MILNSVFSILFCILQELANLYAIASIPHFKFFKNKEVNNFFQSE